MKEKISEELNKIIEKIKENSQTEEGSEASCLIALCRFIEALKEAGVAQEKIDCAINLTKMSEEELKEKTKERMEKLTDKIKEIIEKIDD